MALTTNPISLLNTNGRPHPVQNTAAVVTFVLGLVSAATSISPGLYLTSSWVGLVALLIGGWSQMISATTGQRIVTVLGLGAAGSGFYLGMAHGGLFGGWLG
ncbi:hypothetical protein [Streptomyces sp. PT12]|uniref:hypothetical protein n=1 Tax=Streptomyces sp. PT12 TaxID=1510197 RepID=UPI000DE3F2FD|nr:hypothetical protein [Streptomyces sp. PT12]RBM05556.1 hypothetical protein DEH69_27585 [Streptomyces sp. PT12]